MPYKLLDEVEEEVTVKPSEEEPQGNALTRNILNILSSGAAGFASVPKGLIDLIQAGREKISSLTEQYLPEEERQAFREGQQRMPGAQLIKKTAEFLPGQEEVREKITSYLPEQYRKPQGEQEQLLADIAADVGSLLFPLGAPTKATRALKIAGLGNIGKFLTKKVGGSEALQEGVKIGTMLFTSLGLQDSLKNRAAQMYKQVDELLPESKSINFKPIRETMDEIYNEFSGIGNVKVPSKQAINEILGSLESVAPGNQANIKDLISFKQDLNESLSQAFKYPRARPYINKITKSINETLKNNPEVPEEISTLLKNADEIWSGMSSANSALDYIKNTPKIGGKLGGKVATLLGFITSPARTVKVLGAGGVALGGALGGANAFYILKNLFTKPAIRNEYTKMMAGALKESAPSVIKHANKLEKLLSKEQANEGGRYQLLD